ncbi:unnamed protein product [Brachionus calyciflorus]|uniref:Uncharacterized protein n=1 Tax=Brachionus calyciflorus TaxID=104777 RepID=A0A814P5Z0_9BILA|nr:unnamed protein product [Brachionus calyciflorus]
MSRNEKIDISKSELRLIFPYAFKDCQTVKNLDISFNNLTKIYSKSFNGMTQLGFLYINSNKITQLESDVFQDVPLLTHLYLHGNFIENLDENLFINCKNLVLIHLGWNQIEWLDTRIFKNLRKLRTIILDRNKLKSLDFSLINLESLDYLSVAMNQISEINSETFKGANNLDILKISSNKIQKIYENFTIDFKNLTDLDFSRNNLSFLEPNFFAGLVRLESLLLIECNIKTIDLGSLVNLQNLVLTSNKISIFNQNLSSLTHLSLNLNLLLDLNYSSISTPNSSLKYLDITSCNLNYIDFNILRNLTNLETIRLSGNQITFDNQSFMGFKKLKSVYVNKDVENLKSLFPNISFY